MAEITQTRMTAREFLELPETNQIVELIHGEVIVSPTPILAHQRLVFQIAKYVERLAPSGEVVISPMDVYLSDDDVVQPDVLWISGENSRCKPSEDGYLHGAPDLVIEILSPSTAKRDKKEKFELYQKYGVLEYWLFDPIAKYVEAWRREGERFAQIGVFGPGEMFVSPVLSGETVDVSAFFTP